MLFMSGYIWVAHYIVDLTSNKFWNSLWNQNLSATSVTNLDFQFLKSTILIILWIFHINQLHYVHIKSFNLQMSLI